jgi:hypothetical protein
MAMSWWNFPWDRTDLAAMFSPSGFEEEGERGKCCDAILSSE